MDSLKGKQMKKKDLSVSDEKPRLPEWYWNRGLHDAKILRDGRMSNHGK